MRSPRGRRSSVRALLAAAAVLALVALVTTGHQRVRLAAGPRTLTVRAGSARTAPARELGAPVSAAGLSLLRVAGAQGALDPSVGADANPTDPHRAVTPGAKVPATDLVPDSTPALAAAGLEPGSMAPLVLPADWTSSVARFSTGGLQRSYLLARPSAPAPAHSLPVVVVLHGRNLTPASIERITDLAPVTGPAVLVYPAGYGRSWDAGGCCGEAYLRGIDDVGFVETVVHRVLADTKVADPRHVYVIGFSNGGRMAYRMACADPGAFAGIAAVEAVPLDECPKTDPVPVVIVANRSDPLLTIDAHGRPKIIDDHTQPTVADVVGDWQALDGCSTPKRQVRQGAVVVQEAGGCRDAARVDFAEYGGGGHVWQQPGAGTPGASALVWWLLHQGTLPPAPAPGPVTAAPGAVTAPVGTAPSTQH